MIVPQPRWFMKTSDYGACSCGAERFLRIDHTTQDGAGCFCPRCEGVSRYPRSEIQPLPGLEYEGRLFPDATITWRASAVLVTLEATRRMDSAFAHLRRGARLREEHLRGANRFVFRTDEHGRHLVSYRSTEIEIVGYVAGRRHGDRPSHRCLRCERDIPEGAPGFKAMSPQQNRVTSTFARWEGWSSARFCVECAANAPIATRRGHLIAINGGGKESAG